MQGHAHWLTPFFYVGLKGHMCQMKMYLVWSSSLFFSPHCSAPDPIQLDYFNNRCFVFFIILKMVFQFLLWLLPLCSANSNLFRPAVFVAAASFLNPENAMKSWVDIHTSLCFLHTWPLSIMALLIMNQNMWSSSWPVQPPSCLFPWDCSVRVYLEGQIQ